MTTRDIRIKMMKGHIPVRSLALRLSVPPVRLDSWLNDDNLDEATKQMISDKIDEMLPNWKMATACENGVDKFKLISPGKIDRYRREKARGAQQNEDN